MMQDLILFATADWAEKYWTNKQRMADQFSRSGFRVLYIESFGLRSPGANKKDFSRLFRRLWSGIRPAKKISETLWILSPLVIPLWQKKWIEKLNYKLIRIQIQLFCFLNRFKPAIIWSYHPFITPLLNHINPKCTYYHVVDNITAVPGVDAVLYGQLEKQFLTCVSAIFTTSVTLQNHYRALCAVPVYYSPNVVDVAHFSRARLSQPVPIEMQKLAKPRLLYCGVLSDFKLDLELLCTLATLHPDWEFVFIGEEREGQESKRKPIRSRRAAQRSKCTNNTTHPHPMQVLKQLPNTHFLGYRPYADLPAYLSAADVGILPLLNNDYTRFMFPMKFFEFLAAGLPVVSTPIEGLLPYQHLCSIANTVDEFAAAVERNMNGQQQLISVEEMKMTYSWETRMEQVVSVISSAFSKHACSRGQFS